MIPDWLHEGAMVDLSEWDATEPPSGRYGSPCTVTKVREAQCCGSGVLVDFVNSSGKRAIGMDSGWLKPFTNGR